MHLGAIAMAVVFLAGCRSSPPPEVPPDPPDLAGAISRIDGDSILVAHTEDECGRTQFGRNDATVVLQRTQAGGLEPSSWNALARNQVVQLWQADGRELSCPGGTTAAKVVIQPLGPDGQIDRPVREALGVPPGGHKVVYVLEGQRGRVFGRLEGSCPGGSPRTRWTIPDDGADAQVSVDGRGLSAEGQIFAGKTLAGGKRSGDETWVVTVGVQPEDYRFEGTLETSGGGACLFDLRGRLTGTSRF